jgi:hypothetical protein
MIGMLHFALISLLPLVYGLFLFSGKTDKRIRTCLLSSLKRSYLKEQPQVREVPVVRIKPESKSLIFDIQQKLFSEFLNFRAIYSISQVDSDFRDSLKRAVNQRLVAFHPHFATEDSLVNNLLYCVLNEHFRSIKSANDPLIHDHLQLLCAKYFHNDLNFNAIPSNIYYYIICFMFEMIYETDLKTPVSKSEFLNDFVCYLRVSEHSLDMSYSYLYSRYQSLSNIYPDPEYQRKFLLHCNDLKFFRSKPSLEDIRLKYNLIGDRRAGLFGITCASMFFIAIAEALISTNMDDVDFLFWIYKWFSIPSEARHYSPLLVEIIRSNEALLSLVATSWSEGKYFSLFLEAYKVVYGRELSRLSSTFDSISPIKPLKFYDALNYDMRELISYNVDHRNRNSHIVELLNSQSYSLSKIDACSTMISLDQVKIHEFTNLRFMNNNNYFLLIEIFAKEYKLKLDKKLINNIFLLSIPYVNFLRLLIDILPKNDPFLLLFIPVNTLKLLAKTSPLQDKFDLSLHYSLKEGQSCFQFESGSLGYKMRNHRHFSFKSALSCQDPDVISIFTSNPEEIMNETLPTSSIVRLSSAFDNIKIDPIYLEVSSFTILYHRFKDTVAIFGTFALACSFLYKLVFEQFNVIYFVSLLFVLVLHSLKFFSIYT